jgi:hypothetical protein
LGSKENELTHSKSPQYKINAIGNSTANFWPGTLIGGTGWGVHLGTESDNFDSSIWGNSNDYNSSGGKWISVSKDNIRSIIDRSGATDSDGDNEKIYFGMEIADGSVIPSGIYENDIEFTVLPAF